MTTTSTDLTGWYDDLAATWGKEDARVTAIDEAAIWKVLEGCGWTRKRIPGRGPLNPPMVRFDPPSGEGLMSIHSSGSLVIYALSPLSSAFASGLRALADLFEGGAEQPTPPPCPDCRGSDRKYVHDAFGGCIGMCPRCDGTGVTG